MRFLLIVVPILLSAPLARAANTEEKGQRARTACLAGDAAQGVQLLSELFVTTKDPTYLFNQGRCYEQNLRYEEAIGRFQEYLRVGKKLSKSDRTEAESHIADCEALLAKQRAQAAAAAAPVPPPQPAPPPQPTLPEPQVVQQAKPQAPDQSGSGLRTAGIVTAAVGGAALVAGVVFNVKANSLVSEMKKLDNYSSGKESDQSTYQTLGWVGYGVGAACIAGGAVLYILGLRGDTPTASVALMPAVGPNHAGAILKGAF